MIIKTHYRDFGSLVILGTMIWVAQRLSAAISRPLDEPALAAEVHHPTLPQTQTAQTRRPRRRFNSLTLLYHRA